MVIVGNSKTLHFLALFLNTTLWYAYSKSVILTVETYKLVIITPLPLTWLCRRFHVGEEEDMIAIKPHVSPHDPDLEVVDLHVFNALRLQDSSNLLRRCQKVTLDELGILWQAAWDIRRPSREAVHL